jgi:hypothetical protein
MPSSGIYDPSSYLTGNITFPLQSPVGDGYVSIEVLTAVTMKLDVFWDIKTQIVPHRRETHYVSATEPSRLSLCKI